MPMEIPGHFTNAAVGLKKKLRAHGTARSARKPLVERPILKGEFPTPASSLAARRAARIPRPATSGSRDFPYRPAPEGDDQRWGGSPSAAGRKVGVVRMERKLTPTELAQLVCVADAWAQLEELAALKKTGGERGAKRWAGLQAAAKAQGAPAADVGDEARLIAFVLQQRNESSMAVTRASLQAFADVEGTSVGELINEFPVPPEAFFSKASFVAHSEAVTAIRADEEISEGEKIARVLQLLLPHVHRMQAVPESEVRMVLDIESGAATPTATQLRRLERARVWRTEPTVPSPQDPLGARGAALFRPGQLTDMTRGYVAPAAPPPGAPLLLCLYLPAYPLECTAIHTVKLALQALYFWIWNL